MGLKNVIIKNDRKILNRILFGTEKIKKRDKYALTVGIKFSTLNCGKFTQKKWRFLVQLLETCLILLASLVNCTTLETK